MLKHYIAEVKNVLAEDYPGDKWFIYIKIMNKLYWQVSILWSVINGLIDYFNKIIFIYLFSFPYIKKLLLNGLKLVVSQYFYDFSLLRFLKVIILQLPSLLKTSFFSLY